LDFGYAKSWILNYLVITKNENGNSLIQMKPTLFKDEVPSGINSNVEI
jgi:hypothetical protein